MKFFLDTEFYDDGMSVQPLSIGIVREDDAEFYAEIHSPARIACHDDWILANVFPHFESAHGMEVAQARVAISDFVGTNPAEFWAYWAAYDWVVFCQVMGGLMKLPKNVSPWVRDLAWLDPTLERIRALKIPNEKPHHALYDARELREQHRRLTGVSEEGSRG